MGAPPRGRKKRSFKVNSQRLCARERFAEDVAQKGGVYTVTKGLHKQFKNARVFNTLLDETIILGLAQGYANMGMLPVPEIQYLAYFHNVNAARPMNMRIDESRRHGEVQGFHVIGVRGKAQIRRVSYGFD